jgi:hypothetical protein
MSSITTIRNATATPVFLSFESPTAVLFISHHGTVTYPSRTPPNSSRLRGFVNAVFYSQAFPDGNIVNATADKVMCVVLNDATAVYVQPNETFTLPEPHVPSEIVKVFVGDHFFDLTAADVSTVLPLTAFFKGGAAGHGRADQMATVYLLAPTPADNILEIRTNADLFPGAPSCALKCKTLPSIRLTTHTKTALIVIGVSLGVVAAAFVTFLAMYLSLKRKCGLRK